MAAATTLTWDIAPARRPSLEDVGGAACLDDSSKPPPRDGTHLYADLVNQLQRQVQALAKMIPTARIYCSNSGTPALVLLETPNTTLVGADFTIGDGGVGITNITWVAGKLPALGTPPSATVVFQTSQDVSAAALQMSSVSIQVRTYQNGALSDVPFVVSIH